MTLRMYSNAHLSNQDTDSVQTYRSIAEVIQETGFSRNFIHTEITRGNLQSCKVGSRRVISHGAFAAWMKGKPSEPVPAVDHDALAAMRARLDEIAETVTGIAARLEERGQVLDAIGANLDALIREVGAKR